MKKNLPIDSLRPADDNIRHKIGDVSDLVASIASLGILQDLIVTPHDDDTYTVVAGHRRLKAAQIVGLETVPCDIKRVGDDVRVEVMLVENLLREDLSIMDEASGYFRLVEAGRTVKELASRVGRSARHVGGRLALLELPKRVQAKIDRGDVSIADAAELLRAKDRPEVFAQLVQGLLDNRLHNVSWAVSQALDEADRAERRAEAVARAEAKGLTVIEHDGWGIPTKAGKALGKGHDELEVDKRAHAKEPCHAVVVGRDGSTTPLCTTPTRHAKKGDSEVKSSGTLPREPSPAEADQRARHKANREAAQARQAQLEDILGRRLPKADVVRLALTQFIESSNQAPAKLACNLLGLDAPDASDDYYGTRSVTALRTAAREGDTALTRVALALAFGLAEERMTSSWGAWTAPQVAFHFAFLETAGYARSEFEEAELARAAGVAEEHAEQRRRWAAERAAIDPDEDPDSDVDDPTGLHEEVVVVS